MPPCQLLGVDRNASNLIASIGNQLNDESNATSNFSTNYNHEQAWEMFRDGNKRNSDGYSYDNIMGIMYTPTIRFEENQNGRMLNDQYN